MRVSEVLTALKERRKSMEENVMKLPITDTFQIEFAKQQGTWLGLGEAMNIIIEAAKQEGIDE